MMVLCFSNNIKQGSKYWQELTGQMLGSGPGENHFLLSCGQRQET